MQLKQLGVGKQLGIHSNTVNVSMDPLQVVGTLPIRFEQTATIHFKFKRRMNLMKHKGSFVHETVRPKVIYDVTKYYIENRSLYKEEGVKLEVEWSQNALEDFVSEEDKQNTEDHQSEADETLSSNNKSQNENDDWEEINEDECHESGNRDLLLQHIDFTDDGKHALHIAPGEKNHPLSLFMDTYAEEK